MKHKRPWIWGASLALVAVPLTPVSAFAAGVSVTLTENALNMYAASVEDVGGSDAFDFDVQTFGVVCETEFQGVCSSWIFAPFTYTVSIPWSWTVQSARFYVSPSGLTFSAIVQVIFDGNVSMMMVQRNGAAAYYEPAASLLLVVGSIVSLTPAPVHVNYAGEMISVGSITPYEHYSALIPIGVATAKIGDKKISGQPTNVQVTLHNHFLRITSDVDFNG